MNSSQRRQRLGLPVSLPPALWFAIGLALCGASPALAQVPRLLGYQGSLTNPGGPPITATVSMTFKLYSVAMGGSALYTETQSVNVANGVFSASIGSVTPLALAFDVPYFLGVTVAPDAELSPRQTVAASAYALGVAAPLSLTAGAAPATLSVATANGNANAIYATANGAASPCPECAAIRGVNAGDGPGVYGSTASSLPNAPAVLGEAVNGVGVYGKGAQPGVYGESSGSNGVFGVSTGTPGAAGVRGGSIAGPGVLGRSTTNFGVVGFMGDGSFHFQGPYVGSTGVWGTSDFSPGVYGTSDTNVGVAGVSYSNSGVFGYSQTANAGYFNGTVVVATLAGGGSTSLCRNGSSQIAQCSSSLRYKTNVSGFRGGQRLIERLEPIQFDWRDDGAHDVGLSAEGVAAIDPTFVTYNERGQVEGVKYDRMSVVLINAMKQQQRQIRRQHAQLDRQRVLLETLRAIVCADHPQARTCGRR